MKLFVIVISLLSERFFLHSLAGKRQYWFNLYREKIEDQFSSWPFFSKTNYLFLAVVLPPLLVLYILEWMFSFFPWGIMVLLSHLVVFYACLGPDNPFYPSRDSKDSSTQVTDYLWQVHSQLFAVVIYYILLGPIGILAYRLIDNCQSSAPLGSLARKYFGIIDWVAVRVTALLYLITGNFQSGFNYLLSVFFEGYAKNRNLLEDCANKALGNSQENQVPLLKADILVEHSLIFLLVLVALFTLVAWM